MKRWLSVRDNCDICKCDMSPGKVEYFVDGKTIMGPWALMCPVCWRTYGIGTLGQGLGQKYEGKTPEAHKIGGWPFVNFQVLV